VHFPMWAAVRGRAIRRSNISYWRATVQIVRKQRGKGDPRLQHHVLHDLVHGGRRSWLGHAASAGSPSCVRPANQRDLFAAEPARRITHSLGEYMSLFDPQRDGGSPSGVPLWPAILSLLGPVVLISAIVKNDGLAVYVAGVIVTILGWSQLIPWLRHR